MTQDPYPPMIILRKHFPIAAVLHNGGGLGSLDQPKSETLSPDVLTSVLHVLGVLASRVGIQRRLRFVHGMIYKGLCWVVVAQRVHLGIWYGL